MRKKTATANPKKNSVEALKLSAKKWQLLAAANFLKAPPKFHLHKWEHEGSIYTNFQPYFTEPTCI